ncbi:hypothetical protein D9M69_664510 [compost metagenome]
MPHRICRILKAQHMSIGLIDNIFFGSIALQQVTASQEFHVVQRKIAGIRFFQLYHGFDLAITIFKCKSARAGTVRRRRRAGQAYFLNARQSFQIIVQGKTAIISFGRKEIPGSVNGYDGIF